MEILEILEIKNPTRIISDPARLRGSPQVRRCRLWLSRSKIGGNDRDLNSEPTERRLAHAGWTIAHPETLSIREQRDHLSRTEISAAGEGSAFHTLILLKDIRAKKFHILPRLGYEHGNMRTLGDARRVDQTFYSLERERVLKDEGRLVTKVTTNSSESSTSSPCRS